ncbi:sugar ABC transporter ATP-binding protein [Fuscibacter oryzae]|uniref:Sugar ABC transporter ATP-binding protein n=1 Tax=Fuscibacter oryzae TaxID=2803939 RepID=A0A8J7SWI7_9RHOB|nr:sugar ABC transporter ATP-binding protein [Fuscibacter oryzae]MBL4928974.1 sugar ABC transporter ATP-binding protein [Fuscibacter oryzae]
MEIVLSDITMQFPGTRALDGVTAGFRTDEVHGLIGENGAGKSTLVNILGGSLQPSAGMVQIDGRAVRLTSPHDALVQGIAHVSQEGSLVPGLTGAENILLGAEPKRAGAVIRTGALRAEAAALVAKWFPQVRIDLGRPVGELPMADRKVIEIVRALRGAARIVILDEPTATLPAREKEQLWGIIRRLPQQGVGVVLISHFLSEIKALSDRITVLRDGRHIRTDSADTMTEHDLVDMMLRRSGGANLRGADAGLRKDEVVLDLADWQVGGVHVPQFSLHAGEIVGLIGLTGAGHFGFARSLHNPAGARCARMNVAGKTVQPGPVGQMQAAGIALVPDHRMEYALIGEWTVRENLAMVHPTHGALGAGVLSIRREEAEAQRVMKLLNVKAHGSGQLLKTLSGGNKQKISIGKWLYGAEGRYRVMIFIEPTEGVDIGAKAEIYAEMRRLAAEGVGIIIASSDLLEIESVAHRVIPFANQRPGPEIAQSGFSESTFIAAISGTAA